MPSVAAGGTPLATVGSQAAMAPRQSTSVDSSFAALLAPIAAELDKGASNPVQPETLVPQGSAKPDTPAVIAAPPVEGTVASLPQIAGDGAIEQPTHITENSGTPAHPAGPPVPQPAISSPPLPTEAAQSGTVIQDKAPAVPIAAASAVNTVPEQIVPGQPLHEAIKLPPPPDDGARPQSAAKPGDRAKSDEQTSGLVPPATPTATIAIVQPVVDRTATAIQESPAASPPDPAPSVISADPVTPVEANPAQLAPATPQPGAAKASRMTASAAATIADVATSQHAAAEPQLGAANAIPATLVPGYHVAAAAQSDTGHSLPVTVARTRTAAPPDAIIAAKPQPDAGNQPPVTAAATIAAVPPDAQMIALAPSGVGNVPLTVASTVVPVVHPSAPRQPGSAFASTGPVTALMENAQPPDPTEFGSAVVPVPPNAGTPIPTLLGGNDTAAAAAPLRDVRSDPVASPLYVAGPAAHAAPQDAASAPPFAPVTPQPGTASAQVAMHIAQSLNDGGKTVTIELHPAELGRVEIHFTFHSDGMNVRMTVDRPETFDALSHDRSGLQQQLAQAGVDLGGGGLDLRLGQQQPDQSGGYSSGRTPRVNMPTPQPQGTPATLWVSNSLLDILA